MSTGCTDCCRCCQEPEVWIEDRSFPLAILDSTGNGLIGPNNKFKLDSIYMVSNGDTLWLGETTTLSSTFPFDSSYSIPLWILNVPTFSNTSRVLRLSSNEQDTLNMSFTSEETKCTERLHFEKAFVNNKEIEKDRKNFWYSYIHN